MMKKYILIMLLTLAGLAGMAQTNEPLPSGAVQFSNQLWIVPSDSTIWTGDVFEGKFVNLGSWHKVDSLLALKADADALDDYYTQSQIDAFLALKADESALDDFYTQSQVDGLLDDKLDASEKGASGGVATLDINSKVPLSQIPDALIGSVNYQGNYNAATNTPTLPASPGTATKGHYYVVSTGGTRFGETFVSGDWIISNGSAWQKVDNNNAVTSVNGKVGSVTLNASDVGAPPTSRQINGKALTGNITLNADDVGALQAGDDVSDLVNDAGYITAGDIPAAPVTSVNSKTGAVVIAASDVGLGNVNNTSDANKPVSTAQQNALDLKEDKSNKVTSLSTPNNTTYPTTEAVKNAIDAIEPPEVTGSNGIQVNSRDISPVYGTSSGTVAQGNDSRINNGQTAYNWGDYRQYGLGSTNSLTSVGQFDLLPAESQFISAASTSYTPFNQLGAGIHLALASTRKAQLWFNTADETVQFRTHHSAWNPVRTLWSSNNFNPSNYLEISQKGASNGVASLDGSGKIPFSQLPTSNPYQGTWNANTNSPSISDGNGTAGDWYRVSVGGTSNLGSGNITFSVGDDVIYNGSVWQRAPAGAVSTNLSLGTRTASTMPISNSNGNGVTLPARTGSYAGLMTPSDLSTLYSALQEESDPTVPAYIKSITTGNISNWNTAYSWGNHADYGLGGYAPTPADLDNLFTGGLYYTSTTSANRPYNYSYILNISGSANIGAQLSIPSLSSSPLAYRRKLASGAWTPWANVWDNTNFNPSDYAQLGVGSTQVRNNSQLDSRYLQSGDIPTVGNGTLSLSTGSGLSGTAVFTANQSSGSNFIVEIAPGYTLPTSGQASAWNGKQDAITGAAVTITNDKLTGNRALISGSGGNVAASSTTSTEIEYLSGVTSSVQGQLNGKEASFSKNTAFNKNFGTASGTVAQGNDSRINNGQTAYGWGDYRQWGLGLTNIHPSPSAFDNLGAENQFIAAANSADGPFAQLGAGIHVALNNNRKAQLWFNTAAQTMQYRTNHTGWNPVIDVWTNSNLPSPASLGTGSTQVRNNSQLDARYVQPSDLPTVNNGTLSLNTGTGLTGSANFTANQSGNSTFTVAAASGYAIPTTTQTSNWNTAYSWGNHASAGYAVSGTSGGQVRTNTQLDARYLQSVSGGSGVSVSGGNTVAVDNTVLRTTGNQTKSGNLTLSNNLSVGGNLVHTGGGISTTGNLGVDGGLSVDGTATFSQPVEGAQATASNHFVTKAQMDAESHTILKIDSPFTTSSITLAPGATHTTSVNITGVVSGGFVVVNHWAPWGDSIPPEHYGLGLQGRVMDNNEVQIAVTNNGNTGFSGTVSILVAVIY